MISSIIIASIAILTGFVIGFLFSQHLYKSESVIVPTGRRGTVYVDTRYDSKPDSRNYHWKSCTVLVVVRELDKIANNSKLVKLQ